MPDAHRYTRRPQEVEAIQFDGNNAHQVMAFAGQRPNKQPWVRVRTDYGIAAWEPIGSQWVNLGRHWYIVKDARTGACSFMAPAVFEDNYDVKPDDLPDSLR